MSPEEMRTLYYLGMANGNVQEAQQYEHNLVNQARQMHQKVLNDLEGALDYVIRGETEHPNRLDIVKQSMRGFGQSAIPPSVNPVSAASVLPPTASPLQPLSGHQVNGTATTNGAPKALDDLPSTPLPQPPLSTYAIYDRNNRLTTWKGRPVQYIPLPATEGADKAPVPHFQRQDNGDWERIWFPEGMPPANPDAAPDPQRWGEGFAKAYNFVWEKGEFFGGVMPEEPPGHEFVRWDV
ncbi:hypothetical protein H2201_003946 [Coniosporium apollinis]|uniref:Uncharacterized protein n=1 Tax=Coniosporium apollinis TaxID=61459 RepID=A0ABQ9NWA6_9PEZI|nr:hypothetical protein H2201_003946 [Coniosporium apollinis]